MLTIQVLIFASWFVSAGGISLKAPVMRHKEAGFVALRQSSSVSIGSQPEKHMQEQDIAAIKVKAVYDYVQARLPEGSFWECGTDLEKDIDLYLPNADADGNYGDVYIPLADITLIDGKLDAASEERVESVLRGRSR